MTTSAAGAPYKILALDVPYLADHGHTVPPHTLGSQHSSNCLFAGSIDVIGGGIDQRDTLFQRCLQRSAVLLAHSIRAKSDPRELGGTT